MDSALIPACDYEKGKIATSFDINFSFASLSLMQIYPVMFSLRVPMSASNSSYFDFKIEKKKTLF